MRIHWLLLTLLVVARTQYHQFFADKAATLVNELFNGTQYCLKNLPHVGNITVTKLQVTEAKLEPLVSDAAFLSGKLAASLSVKYDDEPIDIDLVLNAEFKPAPWLLIRSAKVQLLKLTGTFGLFKSKAEGLANRFIEKLLGKPIPWDFSLPSYLALGKGDSQPSSLTFDLDEYIEHRKKVTGWKEEADEPQRDKSTPEANTDEL